MRVCVLELNIVLLIYTLESDASLCIRIKMIKILCSAFLQANVVYKGNQIKLQGQPMFYDWQQI